MASRPKRQTFSEAASSVAQPRYPAEPAAGPANPHACAAHGCPVWGSVILDGTRLCFVHALISNRRRSWDATTARLRSRTGLIEVVRMLRGGGDPQATDGAVLRHALQALPDLADEPSVTSRYRALAAVERILIEECIDREDPLFTGGDRVAEARSQIAALADRFAVNTSNRQVEVSTIADADRTFVTDVEGGS